MRISDWSSDVCSSDLRLSGQVPSACRPDPHGRRGSCRLHNLRLVLRARSRLDAAFRGDRHHGAASARIALVAEALRNARNRSEEHTSELQSLMRISYAVFCLKKTKTQSTSYTKT